MLVTLTLVSANVYSSINAPPQRGFSYIELWVVGMQLPIIIALVEYGIILGIKKYWNNKNGNADNSKIFLNRESNKELIKDLDDTIFKTVDKIFLVLSIVYFTIFCLCYWNLLN